MADPLLTGTSRRARAPMFAGAATLLAVAAAALLWLLRGPRVPEYTLTVEGSRPTRRSTPDDPGGVIKLVPGDRVVITLRLEASAPGTAGARVYLFGQGAAPELRASVEIAPDGAVRINAAAEELLRGIPAGKWALCVSAGEASSLPPLTLREPPPARGDGHITVCWQVEWAP